jgi:hypothetical protein
VIISESDIIIIDYSVNDGLDACRDYHGCRALLNALKALLSFVNSTVSSNNSSLPAILLLETFPYVNREDYEHRLSPSHRERPVQDDLNTYFNVYMKFSDTFHVPKWSFARVVWSDWFSKEQSPVGAKYLRWMLGLDHHPSWHVHLVIADLIAGLFVEETRRCKTSNETMKDTIIPKDVPWGDACDNRFAHAILDITASMHPHWEYAAGNVSRHPEWAWPFGEDGRDRFGWIQTLPTLQSLENATLVYRTMAATVSSPQTYRYELSIFYVRSYENFGVADVYIDGEWVTQLDGLWHEHSRHITVADRFSMKLPEQYRPKEVRIVYRPLKCSMEEDCKKRGHQKMRITGVRICSS